jgi:hypothetical protein
MVMERNVESAAKIGVTNLSMKKSSILVTRYLDYL